MMVVTIDTSGVVAPRKNDTEKEHRLVPAPWVDRHARVQPGGGREGFKDLTKINKYVNLYLMEERSSLQ